MARKNRCFKGAHICNAQFSRLLTFFCEDLSVSQTFRLLGISINGATSKTPKVTSPKFCKPPANCNKNSDFAAKRQKQKAARADSCIRKNRREESGNDGLRNIRAGRGGTLLRPGDAAAQNKFSAAVNWMTATAKRRVAGKSERHSCSDFAMQCPKRCFHCDS